MQWQTGKQRKTGTALFLYLKCGAILLLFIFSLLIVACGGNINNDASLGNTVVTVTINLNRSNASPTPPLPEYTCAAWVTNSSPGINSSSQVGVYAKFEHNVNGNPEGVGQAAGIATVLWPDSTTMNVTASTTNDGLAVFSIPTANRSAYINKTVLVTVSFTKSGVPPCTIAPDQVAFFARACYPNRLSHRRSITNRQPIKYGYSNCLTNGVAHYLTDAITISQAVTNSKT